MKTSTTIKRNLSTDRRRKKSFDKQDEEQDIPKRKSGNIWKPVPLHERTITKAPSTKLPFLSRKNGKTSVRRVSSMEEERGALSLIDTALQVAGNTTPLTMPMDMEFSSSVVSRSASPQPSPVAASQTSQQQEIKVVSPEYRKKVVKADVSESLVDLLYLKYDDGFFKDDDFCFDDPLPILESGW